MDLDFSTGRSVFGCLKHYFYIKSTAAVFAGWISIASY